MKMRTKRFEPKTVPFSQKDVTEERQNASAGPAGVPGAASNGVNQVSQPIAINSKGDTSKETKTSSESLNVVGETEMLESKASFIPETVQASISVPSNYYLDVWNARNPPVAGQPAKTPPAEDLKAIETIEKEKHREHRREALASPQGWRRVISSHSCDDLSEPARSRRSRPPSWLDWLLPIAVANWQAVGMGVLGLVGVVVLRGMMKSASPGEAAGPIEEEPEEVQSKEPPPPGVISQLRERFNTSGPSLREELQSLVQEDPDAAATVLKNWIGEAA